MGSLLLFGDVVLPDQILKDYFVHCVDGRIVSLSAENIADSAVSCIDFSGHYVSPGFVDIHVHGGANSDYMDGNHDAVVSANRAHAKHGTTTIFPTTTTGSFQQLSQMGTACELAKESWDISKGARIGGVHFYGPYFAEDKTGCHSPEGRRDPEPDEYHHFLRKEIVNIATCASELPGAREFYQEAKASDCFITCGHSNACWAELDAAFTEGMRHVDHFWCAMSSVVSLRKRFGMPMQAGMEQFVLANQEMSTEVLADGQHLSDDLLRFAYQMIGPERVCLVTDASRAMDCPPGRYQFGSSDDGSWLSSDGIKATGDDGGLASTICGMDTMVKNMYCAIGESLPSVIRMASLTPATLTGVSDYCGSIEPGKRADFVILTHDLTVESVFIDGKQMSQ